MKTLKKLIKQHHVNVVNVSARHVHKDNESLLTFAPEEACSLVLYINVVKHEEAYKNIEQWTREVINAALASQGTYYLPYQLLATQEQFERAYPKWKKLLQLKKKYDPQGLFSNMLYEKYGPNA